MSSEFGKGLCYCLGLFLAHAEGWRWKDKKISENLIDSYAGMWFMAASDHLYDIQIDYAPKHLRKRIKRFSDKSINWRLDPTTEENVLWAIQEAKDLLRLIDKANGIPTGRGYE